MKAVDMWRILLKDKSIHVIFEQSNVLDKGPTRTSTDSIKLFANLIAFISSFLFLPDLDGDSEMDLSVKPLSRSASFLSVSRYFYRINLGKYQNLNSFILHIFNSSVLFADLWT